MRSIRLLTVAAVCVMLGAQSAQTQVFKALFDFNGSDGALPYAGLIQDSKGNLYGTTQYGGAYNYGTVFTLSKSGQETVLYNFCSLSNCRDGAYPNTALTQDAEGNLYATTYSGGGTGCGGAGCGVVFKLSKAGRESVLHSFCSRSTCGDGANPQGGVIRDAQGNFYGTTIYGGAYGHGTVFKLSNTGKEIVLHSFCSKSGCPDGSGPVAKLLLGANGNLYGTSGGGGLSGWGAVFKLYKSGKFFTLLYSFTNTPDGAQPDAGVIQDANGNIYGTTTGGGAYKYGTVFKLSKTGRETVLHSFTSVADGAAPNGAVIRDVQGNLYGTTTFGGAYTYYGTVFKLSKTGHKTTLHSFTGGTDGALPYAELIQDSEGNLYGTTSDDGVSGYYGTVFKLTP
jgi:uncharacterized repeat protein (TIGR03803 family)